MSDDPTTNVSPPGYPSVAGLAIPDLSLANLPPDAQQTSLAGGHIADSTPPQKLDTPGLVDDGDGDSIFDDIKTMGIDESKPYYHLNLAGEAGFPTPSEVVSPDDAGGVNAPTWAVPSFTVPGLKQGDLTGPGIEHFPAFAPDPYLGDLLQVDRPEGLIIHAATDLGRSVMQPDPMAPDLSLYDRPDGLQMPGPLLVDPNMPDLQSPQLEQDVHMQGRPGELAPGALDVMHGFPTYSQARQSSYPSSQFDIGGTNSRERRHNALLMQGLDEVEK